MYSKQGLTPSKPRRIPRKGCFFLFIRILGWLSIITSLLLILIAAVGFLIMLVRTGPELVESIRYVGQQRIAGLVFFGLLGYLLIFPIVGFIGIVLAVFGLVFRFWSTEAEIGKPTSEADDQGKADLKME